MGHRRVVRGQGAARRERGPSRGELPGPAAWGAEPAARSAVKLAEAIFAFNCP